MGHAQMESPVAVDRNNNLPAQLTTLIGRELDVAEVKRLLESCRLVSLTGSGGVGKTRLALRVASEMAQARAYSNGVWLVKLAGLTDANLLQQALLSAVRGREAPGRSLDDALLEFLAGRRLLLVMDNCEHLVDACAQLVERMLEALPDLHVLATGRESLGVPGEITWRVPSLALPEVDRPVSPDQLMECASVRLLVERAHAAMQEFALSSTNMVAIAAVCRRLGGIPLAIELAAARLSVLTAEQLAERLGDVFRVLPTGSRRAAPRQRTLWATVDWSYKLLSERERSVFRRCGVFVGGWSLESAETVCAGDSIEVTAVLDLIAQLVSKSLVVGEERRRAERYRMLEPIRQFAVEELTADDAATAVRDRHLAWLVELGERAERELWGPQQLEWLEQLELEHDNIRAALEWGRASGQWESMLRLAAALARFWDVRGFLTEGYGWLSAALDATTTLQTISRAQALARAGYLAVVRNDLSAADRHLADALALAQVLEDEESIGAALMVMGMAARARGEYQEAASRFEQSLEMSRRAGHRPGIYTSMYLLASAVRFSGDYQRAIALHEESLALKREQGDTWGIGVSLFSLGSLARILGDHQRAQRLYRESLDVRWHLGDRIGICVCLEALAGLATDAALASRLLGAAERLREQVGLVGQTRRAARETQQLAASLRSALGEEAFTPIWRAGRNLALDQVVAEALSSQDRPHSARASGEKDDLRSAELSAPISENEFRDLVEDALRHLNDAPALRQHRLLGLTASAAGSHLHAAEAAALLQGDLLQAIERLRPSTPRPSPGTSSGAGAWLHYLVLYESYVAGRGNSEIMLRYYLSEGTFYRARRHAIDAVAQDLAQRRPRTMSSTA